MMLLNKLSDTCGLHTIFDCPTGLQARIIAELAHHKPEQPLLVVMPDELRAAQLQQQLAFFAPNLASEILPAWDCLPYDRAGPSASVVSTRLATLAKLANLGKRQLVVITTIAGLLQRLPPLAYVRSQHLDLRRGATLDPEQLQNYLLTTGYVRTDTVRDVGEYAWRGGILDLFPSGAEKPLRLDLFGNTIESLRSFDPLTQRSDEKIEHFVLQPGSELPLDSAAIEHFRGQYRALFGNAATEDALYIAISEQRHYPGQEHWLPLFFPQLATLADYLPNVTVIGEVNLREAMAARQEQINEFYEARRAFLKGQGNKANKQHGAAYRPLPPEQLYWPKNEIEAWLQQQITCLLSPFSATELDVAPSAQGRAAPNFAAARSQGLPALWQQLQQELASSRRRGLIACYTEGSRARLFEQLNDAKITQVVKADSLSAVQQLPERALALVILPQENGYSTPDQLLLTEQDLLGDRLVRQRRTKKASEHFMLDVGDLALGDLLVHAEHGIGRYLGLETIQVVGAAHDCIKLEYADNAKLFVPVENMELLSRYGSDQGTVTLDRLGAASWQARKAKVKARLKDMTGELIKIAALRALQEGEQVDVPAGLMHEFTSRFPYAETEDQARAIEDVLADLASGKPMDRLVCGDVGFGKTEVALRAAFAAAQAGMQVAVLVPTTLLARQHAQNFLRRFHGLPYRVAQLSRFVDAASAKQIKAELADGTIDVVVGTHALLAKDIAFKRLGLMIIDEEQHFGVKQKEKLKQLRANIHCLTLTATPIPRTLQLSLAGVREMSLITTPPIDRLAVHSFVLPFDPVIVRQAIMREHYRGGQSFVVCPRIEDLADVQQKLAELVPEVKLMSAHGQLPAGQLDDIMTAFDAAQFDVLLATNIIESGLDIPNANTLIIHRADMFGLSQLYQLRGRVGRGKQRGYAYFTYSAEVTPNPTALRRLEIIQTLDQLGAGFQLASHDMDLRGAGNLLGEEQSGHIREVGVELYQQLLEEAVQQARSQGQAAKPDWTPQINLGLPVLIPEAYVTDLNVRLGLYRRLADLTQPADLESFAAELIDRFGPLPIEVNNLLKVLEIKQLCRAVGAARVDVGPKGAVIGFYNDQFAGDPSRLIAWLQQQAGAAKFRPDQRLVLLRAWDKPEDRMRGLQQTLSQLASLAA